MIPRKKKSVLIAPSILAANFGDLGDQIATAEKAGADYIHLDIMDGHFVPNISFGSSVVKTVRGLTRLPLDTHLMIENPDLYLEEFQRAGATNLTVHVEACRHLQRTVSAIRQLGMKPGVSLNPATPLGTLEDILPEVDNVLLMSVNPGFGGQQFLRHSLERIRHLRDILKKRKLHALIEVDGGIDTTNASEIINAGADVLVVGTAVFGSPDIGGAIKALRKSADRG
ncbi:MAG TPA: ribulose-phosphate 3-epimerase [Bacteroidota bacterium]|nr:ribulose-phosphate 3-epimerase [Bacteroidota bacterium]